MIPLNETQCVCCRRETLTTRRQRMLRACWRCLRATDEGITRELGLVPDYGRRVVRNGVVLIGMKRK